MSDNYDEEFENQNYDDEFGEIEREINNNHHNKNQEDEDDEQSAQKFNGKIETMQLRIEELEGELTQERELGLEMRQQYEKELQSAWKEQTQQEELNSNNIKNESKLQNEINKYKTRCDLLQEQLDLALVTSSSTTKEISIPEELQSMFHKLCAKLNFPDDKKKLASADCIEILQNALQNQLQLQKSVKALKESQQSQAEETGESVEDATNNQDSQEEEDPKKKLLSTKKLKKKMRSLEEDFKNAGEDSFIGSIADASGGGNNARNAGSSYLKNKIFQLSERIRVEKESKRALELEVGGFKKKLDMLSDHIEKLMLHLKREGAQKVRLAEQVRTLEKEIVKIKEKSDIIFRKSSAKDRLLVELREGSKILEDQLRLMDEKYLELRSKLDYARVMSQKKIKKAEKVAADLRVKFIMATGGNPNLMLDTAPMSATNSINGGGGGGGGYGTGEYDPNYSAYDDGWMGEEYNYGNNSAPGGKRNKVRMNLPPRNQGLSSSMNALSFNNDTHSLSDSVASKKSTISMDSVQEKIRLQMGGKQEWTEDKAKKLAFNR